MARLLQSVELRARLGWARVASARALPCTDRYELAVHLGALASGTAQRQLGLRAFPRRLPEGRRYGAVAGVGGFLEGFEDFRFDDEVLGVLDEGRVVDEANSRGSPTTSSPATSGATARAGPLPLSPLVVVEA